MIFAEVMMRKYLLIICCMIWSVAAVAQTYQRSNKGPNFFMPTGAMDSSAQRQRQNQAQQQRMSQPQVQQRQAQPKAQTQAGQQLRQQKVQQPVRKVENSPQKTNISQPKKPTTTAVNSSTVKTAVPTGTQKPVAIKQKNIGNLIGVKIPPEKAVVKVEETKEPAPKTLLAQIIEDYENDLKLIGQNQKVRNIRLQKVLSSFQDKDIEF